MIKLTIKFTVLLFAICLNCSISFAQFTDRYWCFGDSAAIDFSNLNNPVPSNSILRVRGTCVSICDSLGDLIFYGGSPNLDIWMPSGPPYIYSMGYLCSNNNQKILNGDSLKSTLAYQEMIIVPNPGNSSQFYVFTAGVTPIDQGFFYNIVDMSLNSGLGSVIQKNIPLQSFTTGDGIAAVKHGNGTDWWIVMREYSNIVQLDTYYLYLVSAAGLSGPFIQHIGTPTQNGSILRLKFTPIGDKLFALCINNLFEIYDFDRCTGILSNVNTINTNNPPYDKKYFSFAISQDGSKLYTSSILLTSNQDSSNLVQYDLNAADILASADTLHIFTEPTVAGLLQLGPNGKIYLAAYEQVNDCAYDYLYCDTTWTNTNMNLSVINSPDSLGTACDFQPFSFSLGGHRTYLGLPNNPNYELGPLLGSPCDTLSVGINEIATYKNNIIIYYDSPWQTAFLNAKGLRGKTFTFQLFNMNGQLLINESGSLDSEYYTKNIVMSAFEDGVYFARISTEKEILTSRFVKY